MSDAVPQRRGRDMTNDIAGLVKELHEMEHLFINGLQHQKTLRRAAHALSTAREETWEEAAKIAQQWPDIGQNSTFDGLAEALRSRASSTTGRKDTPTTDTANGDGMSDAEPHWLELRKRDDTIAALTLERDRLTERCRGLETALQPFANYADPNHLVHETYVITSGSQIAKRQLTMGDCYDANSALSQVTQGTEDCAKCAGWQTMENAPRDGSDVLLFTTCHGIVEAWFSQGEWSEETPISPREYSGSSWVCADDAFQIEVEETPYGYWDGTATAWQPLPPPPLPANAMSGSSEPNAGEGTSDAR